MEQAGTRRRLAAIMFADAAGFSRLMGIDEQGTVATLAAARSILQGRVDRHGGRLVGSSGDGFLAEFVSVVDAVNCAIDIQRSFIDQNAKLPPERRLSFRIGVNIGDVIVADDDDIFGDGVNIAARLEKLSEPGGICISGDVYNQVRNKIELNVTDLGERSVKNIGEPVRVFRVDIGPTRTGEPTAFPTLPLPGKPSIAVLPFVNMDTDPDLVFVSDGLSEELIGDLSRLRELFVIARNSSFVFRGASIEMAPVAAQLGVRFLLAGSVRPGEELAIEARLIDATAKAAVWSATYTSDFAGLFEVYAKILRGVAGALGIGVDDAAIARASRRRASNADAYEHLLRGRELYGRQTLDDDARAREAFAKAIEHDSQCAEAFAWLAVLHMYEFRLKRRPDAAERSVKCARSALAIDDDLGVAHQVLGYLHLYRKRFLQAQFHMSKAVGLDPNDAVAIVRMGLLNCYLGKSAEALDYFQRSNRLNPCHPGRYHGVRGMAYFVAHRYEDALAAFEKLDSPYYWDRAYMAGTFAMLARIDDARSKLAEVLHIMPSFAIDRLAHAEPFQSPDDKHHFIEALRRCGLPG
jgi:adenylate cyclase